MYSSFINSEGRSWKKTRYRASGTRSLFPAPTFTFNKYIGPELHNETQIISLPNKEKKVIQGLSQNIIFLFRTKVGFGSPSRPYFKYVILISRKDFRYRNKEKTVIQDLNYNLCFVDPSFGFIPIVLPSFVSFTSWIS